jgi:hypothetical protein
MGYTERWEGFLGTAAASSFPFVRTDSVKRGRFISRSILAINFFPLSELFGFILRNIRAARRSLFPIDRPRAKRPPLGVRGVPICHLAGGGARLRAL